MDKIDLKTMSSLPANCFIFDSSLQDLILQQSDLTRSQQGRRSFCYEHYSQYFFVVICLQNEHLPSTVAGEVDEAAQRVPID